MAGRKPDPLIADLEDDLAALSEIREAAHLLFLRETMAANKVEVQRIVQAAERIRQRTTQRRQYLSQLWK